MKRKLFFTTAAAALLGLGMTPLFASRVPGLQEPAASQTDSHQKSLDIESAMENHQGEMEALLIKLDESFQVIADSRDTKGYVRNKAALKIHEANIKALRNIVRDHKLLLSNYEHQCGVTSEQPDAMVQHQHEMLGALHDVVESFDDFAQANDQPNNPYIYVTKPVGQAFTAHREALDDLENAIAQHKQAMVQMMEKCS